MSDRVIIFDTTLRDGEQSPGCSMNTAEKLEIAAALVDLGVDVIEAGFPIASPGDFEAVQAIARQFGALGPKICGLARCRDEDIDRAGNALKEAKKAALGLRELLRREVDRVDDEDQLGRRLGWSQRVVHRADLCPLAIVEKGEIPGLDVRNRIPCRIGHNHGNAEESVPNHGIGAAEGREWLLPHGRIVRRRVLPVRSPGTNNQQTCKKGSAQHDRSIPHDSRHPEALPDCPVSGADQSPDSTIKQVAVPARAVSSSFNTG